MYIGGQRTFTAHKWLDRLTSPNDSEGFTAQNTKRTAGSMYVCMYVGIQGLDFIEGS